MRQLIKVIFFLSLSSTVSACIIDQLSTNNANFVDWPAASPTWGQSFEACETGEVWEIAVWPHWQTVGIHSLVLKDINCVLMWTVSNINITGLEQIIVDLSTGSGSSRNVTSGTSYIFQLVGPAGGVISMYDHINDPPYLQGTDIADNCASYGLDWWFRVGINEGLVVLPAELLRFSGEKVASGIQLNWQTASEENASHFEIERSADGRSFETIGAINAIGEAAEYSFLDEKPLRSMAYYRLKMNDLNRTFEYSDIISMAPPQAGLIDIFPIPTTGGLNVYFEATSQKNSQIQILDLAGKVLISEAVESGKQEYYLPLTSFLNGIYFLKITENGFPIRMEKIIKQ